MSDPQARLFGVLPLPSSLDPKKGAHLYRQGVAMTMVLVGINLITLLLTLGVATAQLITDYNLSTELRVLIGITSISLIQTALYYRFTNVRATSMVMLVFYYIMTVLVVFITGGFDSPVISILLCTIAVSYRFGQREDGLMNTLLVGFALLTFMALQWLEMPPVYVLKGLNQPTVFFLGWFATLFTISACLLTYHYDRKD